MKIEKISVYFTEPGPENTDEVIKAVTKRVEEGDVKTVVVASTSGRTGLKFAETLKGKVKVVVISHEKMRPEFKENIIKLGGIAVDKTHLPFHKGGIRYKDVIRNTFYTLGQGFKVAVEVILIATDKKLIEPYIDVIGVAGSGKGSDTAIVARSTTSKEIFSRNKTRKLEVREVIAMPLKKKWW
ncbi:hypothetical protein KEJ50_05530 [Candidatus Bathyarchaeota archaeon]|nr:hypothetical protein [Candidatus Bathyarchaeota archaeon]